MTDTGEQALLLQDIVRRESRSLLQYVSEAFPWTNQKEQAALASVQRMVEEERRDTAVLGQFLVRRRIGVPYLGPYPLSFTNINYTSLDHLLPMLVQHQRRAIEQLESDLRKLSDPEAQQQVRRILEIKRRHLQTLEHLSGSPTAAAAS